MREYNDGVLTLTNPEGAICVLAYNPMTLQKFSSEQEAIVCAEQIPNLPYHIPTPEPILLASDIAAFKILVDTEVDQVVTKVIGSRQSEYELAEREAQAFKDSAYAATPVPGSVASWAAATAMTDTEAADSILAAATAWRTLQSALRATRLQKKQAAEASASRAELATVRESWNTFIQSVNASL